MNDLLHLKGGKFEQKSRDGRPGPAELPKNGEVNLKKMNLLLEDLKSMLDFWSKEDIISGALVSAYYRKIAAKSNRLRTLLSIKSNSPNDSVVGAKFSGTKIKKHVITHYVPIDALKKSIFLLEKAIEIVRKESIFNGEVKADTFNEKNSLENIDFKSYGIARTIFRNIIVDAYYVDNFDIETPSYNKKETSIITLFKTDETTKSLFDKIGIHTSTNRIMDDVNVLLDEYQLDTLLNTAPYLISMATTDFSKLDGYDFQNAPSPQMVTIPKPSEEPTIGVIDTLFDKRVYFGDWVEYYDIVSDDISKSPKDYKHGTSVTSIIVDGPSLNPELDDNCGRFKVRHFGVAVQDRFSSFTIIRTIKEIIVKNRDIRVWNLSLGSQEEVNENFISIEGAILDQIQFDYDVIFVISGTNKNKREGEKRIGSPADSINGLTVNSVDKDGNSTHYSRKGPVLSFFTKPDISYYGGANGTFINACEPLGKVKVSGTSFAAPWISRKVAYLIHIMGFSKEVAKALLIDSAIGWNEKYNYNNSVLKGHGIVPIKIEEIIQSEEDEIKFVVTGESEKYNSYNLKFPIPVHKGKHPFIARATLCYFPKCSRSQGVDYTNTELDVYFGRIKDDGGFSSINDNRQSSEDNPSYLLEEDARKLFRKWDNIKNIQEKLTSRKQPKKAYKNSLWGLSVKSKERLNPRNGKGLPFGVVVTLKELNGVNRIEDFIYKCSFNGWLVNRINVENQIDIYNKINETVEID